MDKIRRQFNDLKIINYYVGFVIICISALILIPIAVSLSLKEYSSVIDFIITLGISLISALVLMLIGDKHAKKFEWKHGLVISSLSWVYLTILCSIPYYLSGNVKSFIDGCFDVMSGFTTTGLVLTQDIDHISYGFNIWRHMLTFVGGQGMVVLALSFLVKDTVGAYKMYVGEGKDIELLPNVKSTVRIIWEISIAYLVAGTFALWLDGLFIGLKPISSLYHGVCIFMSAWSTGGFAPMSQNMLYYHSFSYELITIVFFIIGSFNFGLHYAIWQGDWKEIGKNIETKSFFITATVTSLLVALGLTKLGVYPNAVAVFRKGIYSLLSAHTTTGFSTVYARQFALEWGDFGILIMVIAMMIGGSACSTAGGFKGLRVGIVFKGIVADVKKSLSSDRKVQAFKYHHIKDQVLDDGAVRSAALIIICYMIIFAIGTAIGCYYGYPLPSAAFESASVSGNVGLSIGVTSPSMPMLLKVYYIIAMYLGRLEFVSVFALIGFVFGGIKRLCQRY